MYKISSVFEPVNSVTQDFSLGITEEITQPPPPSKNQSGIGFNSFERQDSASKLLPKSRVNLCMKYPRAGAKIEIHTNSNDRAYYTGLIRCGSVWECYICASKISEGRRQELSQAIEKVKSIGGSVAMGTFTVPHYRNTSLKNSREGITLALLLMFNRKPFKRFCTTTGYIGRIRSFEITYGQNGWHPHIHVLFFFKSTLTASELKMWEHMLRLEWIKAVSDTGLLTYQNGSSNTAFILKPADYAANYVSKWGLEHEMTKSNLKLGSKSSSITPFGLLDIYSAGGKDSDKAGLLFVEYCNNMFGSKQLVWSKGLRCILGLSKALTDQELADLTEPIKNYIADIDPEVFLQVRKRKLASELLRFAEQLGSKGVDIFLTHYQLLPKEG